MQMGRHAAANILRTLEGQPRRPFRYRDKGSLATIGRKAAVAEIGGVRLSGFLAWLAWLGIHIFFLIGFRNRAGRDVRLGAGLRDLRAQRADRPGSGSAPPTTSAEPIHDDLIGEPR